MEARKDYFEPMHTAEHILNQTMVRLFGCDRSFSNHIERKKSKCDYKFEKALSDNDISLINNQVNEVINSHLDVHDEVLSYRDANNQFKLDRIPGNQPESIRIVRVGDYDACPCIGKHVKNTKEIGEFKITTTSFNDGVLRIRYKLIAVN